MTPLVTYLAPRESMPELADDEAWLIVEASDDGRFFGSGWAKTPSGEGVVYVSLPETDVSLESALAAALEWANRHDVGKIYVDRSVPEV